MAYASVDDLTSWLAPDPAPDTAMRLLEQASDVLDELLVGAVYDPDDPEVVEVLRRACVRQAHWMIERDDETGASSDIQSMATGQRSFSRRVSAPGSPAVQRVAPAAAGVLRTSGLLAMWPLVVG